MSKEELINKEMLQQILTDLLNLISAFKRTGRISELDEADIKEVFEKYGIKEKLTK